MRRQIKRPEIVPTIRVTTCIEGSSMHNFNSVVIPDGRVVIICCYCGQVSTILPAPQIQTLGFYQNNVTVGVPVAFGATDTGMYSGNILINAASSGTQNSGPIQIH